MEKIKVNMSPNPLDVQTIHASQNDGEARQWEFELHNNGELIDTSGITEQLFFKAYKGGTEQILPENTSTPTTSPFKGDIRYPQGLLTDQEFTYRQSPTESDGLAKITDIKGNTLNWNQLIQNGNFAGTSVWTVTGSGSSFTVSNNIATVTASGAYDRIQQNVNFISGHKYLIKADIKKTNANDDIRLYYGNHVGGGSYVFSNTTEWQTLYVIRTASESTTSVYPNVEGTTSNLTWQQRNMMIIDLTKMGLDITDPSGFTSLFPLSYYSYNQGSLLSFNGNGIKTVGKNLFDFSQFANGTITFENGVLTGTAGQFYSAVGIDLVYPKNAQITISFDARTEQNQASAGGGVYLMSNENGTPVQLATTANSTTAIQHITVTIPSNRHIDKLGWSYGTGGANIWHITNFQVEFGIAETSYEPYTSSTLSLPISTYFPTGMKSKGDVYDELTENKAITRVGSRAYQSGDESDTSVITDGTTTYYALATPTETSFTTASLVTENAEIPLSNEDGTLIGKCTEELSAEPGFHDAKIKLTDSDGECYSNKLQLHVERKPS